MSAVEMSFENLNLEVPFINLNNLNKSYVDKAIKTRGFVCNINVFKKTTFLTLRDQNRTLQCVLSTTEAAKSLNNESYIEVEGKICLVSTKIKSCSFSELELQLHTFAILNASESVLPFSYKDVSYTLEDLKKYNVSPVSYHLCLDNRSLYLRSPQGYAITRILDAVMFKFRDFLRSNGFIEVKTPKLIGGASEGGANCFKVDYFAKTATLAQSPQLYKQMCILGGLKRVYEIGHVYRAEESNINRYLSEFIGLDLEMEITDNYISVINFIYDLFKSIFVFLSESYSSELETIKQYFEFEPFMFTDNPVILDYIDCMKLLKDEYNIDMKLEDDFNNENEKKLGEIVKKKWNTDVFVIKDYPVCCRPFYTAVDSKTGFTKSYDFIIRGEEILSGAERINCYKTLKENIERCGINISSLGGYLEAFKIGAPPHGGCGIGLERLVKAYFGMKDIRYFSLFPRDPNRLYP